MIAVLTFIINGYVIKNQFQWNWPRRNYGAKLQPVLKRCVKLHICVKENVAKTNVPVLGRFH